MSHHKELSTEKYWNESVQKEIKELLQQKKRESIQAFSQFVFSVAVFSMTVITVNQWPNWFSAVAAFMKPS